MIPPKQTLKSVTLKTNKQFMREALFRYPDRMAFAGWLYDVTGQIRDDDV